MAESTTTTPWKAHETTSQISFPRAPFTYRTKRQEGPSPSDRRGRSSKVSFIENKVPNFRNIQSMLQSCAEVNHWANRGPLYHRLAERFSKHLNIKQNVSVIPCANCGIGLEALARLLSLHRGRKLRWIAPSFCFSNIGRGYFSDVTFIDCDKSGVLSWLLDELSGWVRCFWVVGLLLNPVGRAFPVDVTG
ncbi:MAG: hypothetical protein ACI89J_004055, partial [Hyphomicrobiaceae bacterium]